MKRFGLELNLILVCSVYKYLYMILQTMFPRCISTYPITKNNHAHIWKGKRKEKIK
jgi:hypothetical protein